MGVLSFDGTIDRLKWTTLSATLQNLPTGAYTLAWLFKRGGAGGFDALGYFLSGTGDGTAEIGASINVASDVVIDNGSGSIGDTVAVTFTNTTLPLIAVVTKADGSATPRLHYKLDTGGAWTHIAFDTADGDQSAVNALELGAWQNGDFFIGHLGLFAAWNVDMAVGGTADAAVESLDDNWRTTDWWNHSAGTPVCLIELNVAPASLVDLAGNVTAASRVAESGGNYPTLDAGQTLAGWTFDGTGAPAGIAPNVSDAVTVTEDVGRGLPLMPYVIEPHVP